MSFTPEEMERLEGEMVQRLRQAYGDALEQARLRFLSDPHTQNYLHNDSDTGLTVEKTNPAMVKILSAMFHVAADPKPPFGAQGLTAFFQLVRQISQDTPDGGESAETMLKTLDVHVAKLKGEHARHLN